MKSILPFLIPITFLGFIVLAYLFVSTRLAKSFPLLPPITWKILTLILTFGCLISMMTFTVTDQPVGRLVFQFSSLLVGFMLYVLLSFLFLELLQWVRPITPENTGIIAMSLALLICGYGLWNAYTPSVKRVEIPLRGLQKEIRAVHLTDIHLGNFRAKKYLAKVVSKVNELEPEVIFHTGDLFDALTPLREGTLDPFSDLKAPHFFVEGNHDIHVGVKKVMELARKQQVTVLQNEVDSFDELQIIGLKHMLSDSTSFDMHASGEGMTVKKVLNQLQWDTDKPTVVLHHAPNGYQYADQHGAELLLAGHTHAGQMWPLTYVAKWIFGYNRGLYQYENLAIYVSQGVGTMFTPMRVGTQSEITLLRLIPGQ